MPFALKKLLTAAHQNKSITTILALSPSALRGVSQADADRLDQAFGIKTIEDMGKNAFFQNIVSKPVLSQRSKSLPQSSAGIGRRLNTQRFTDIIAQRSIRSDVQPARAFVITQTIPIGPATCSRASCLSVGVSGRNISPSSIQSQLRVSLAW